VFAGGQTAPKGRDQVRDDQVAVGELGGPDRMPGGSVGDNLAGDGQAGELNLGGLEIKRGLHQLAEALDGGLREKDGLGRGHAAGAHRRGMT